MKILLLAITACIVATTALPVTAADLLIIQSQRRDIFDQAAKQVENRCGRGSETMVMSDYAEFDLGRVVREEQPRIVLAIGEQAFKEARKLRRQTVVYSHTLNVDQSRLPDSMDGVSMHVAPELYMKLFKKSGLNRVAVIFDPKNSGSYIQRSMAAARAAGVELVTVKVSSPREVPAALESLTGRSISAVWMIPDSSAVASETLDSYFLFGQKHNLPVITFAKGYLAKGATLALEGSRPHIPSQICEIISRLRSGNDSGSSEQIDINRAKLHSNQSLAKKHDLDLPGLERLFPPDQD